MHTHASYSSSQRNTRNHIKRCRGGQENDFISFIDTFLSPLIKSSSALKLPSTMLFQSLVTLASAASLVAASPNALPWAQANPEAAAAAEAYAQAYAEAKAIAHPDPEAYALAASADDCASIGCHAACGYLILNGAACSTNTTDTYSGPYNTTCLCSEGSKFLQRYTPCMECGWTLWKYYGPYVSDALAACSTLSTEPTGTLRCSTTLTDSYSKDANAGCAYGGVCVSSTQADASNSTNSGSGSSNSTADYASSTSADSSSASGSSTEGSSDSESSSTDASASSGSSDSSSSDSSSSAGSSSSSAGSSSSTAGAAAMLAGSSVVGAFLVALLI
ncbi:CYFA0S26e00672g1_1 [Cyberlindnera fabianii]|uniref:CYFA0S26e00672g1_1 n=1 Tax=Cyberlindnera fabianii TaxID=36022 RepID=A0A061BG22_CYBFA|nr:CYFA0S26e00672g1_1 [Cyberlindnera fabianii]